MALRQLADDVRERFARLRVRGHPTGSDKAKRRTKAIAQSSTGSVSGDADRTETPDLIRPHVDTTVSTTSSMLPPLPPTPTSEKSRPRPARRRTSAYLCPSASAAVMSHIYEEIPTTPPPLSRQQRSGSTSTCCSGGGAEVGRVYYVSPLDGALCRIFPVEERAVHRRQLACAHVRRQPSSSVGHDWPPSPPIDVADIVTSGLSMVRGRELRLCAGCYLQLRSTLGQDETSARDCRRSTGAVSPSASTSFYNSCDLSLLTVPCCYSSEAGDDISTTAAAPSSTPSATQDAAAAESDISVSGDVTRSRVAPKFGEAGSAFTKFAGGGERCRTDEGPRQVSKSDENVGRRTRPFRVGTNPSFDERRRPLRNADDSLLAVLDSAPPDTNFRSRYLDLSDDVDRLPQRQGIICTKSTSCADVRYSFRQ